MAENGKKKGTLIGFLFRCLLFIAIGVIVGYYIATSNILKTDNNTEEVAKEVVEVKEASKGEKNVTASGIKYDLAQGVVSNFDLSFLKLENKKENKIYSPLSIKYTLKMLEEGASGNSKKQIADVTGDYIQKKYTNSKNMALANAFFVRDTYEPNVKTDFIANLKKDYNAEVVFDSFKTAKAINDFVKDNTLELIPNLTDDDTVSDLDFALVNALGIDMRWNEKFLSDVQDEDAKYHSTSFDHIQIKKAERKDEDFDRFFYLSSEEQLHKGKFNLDSGKKLDASGMNIKAMICNYDALNEIGKDKIEKVITEQFTKYISEEEYDEEHAIPGYEEPGMSEEEIKKYLDEYLPVYFNELERNYHNFDYTTEFSIYDDEDVKVFAKDLKEYDGTTLEYVGIMPKEKSLDSFIDSLTSEQMNKYIESLKTIDYKNFEEGYVTLIEGYIPKFNFDYELNLMDDLKEQNITDVFDREKADLSNMVEDEGAFISTAIHKANIEFTEDGIKAAAATMVGGLGAGNPFDYFFDAPVKRIDMTFDNPYMFVIRDKDTGDVWFTGTVYEPLSYEEDSSPNKPDYNY